MSQGYLNLQSNVNKYECMVQYTSEAINSTTILFKFTPSIRNTVTDATNYANYNGEYTLKYANGEIITKQTIETKVIALSNDIGWQEIKLYECYIPITNNDGTAGDVIFEFFLKGSNSVVWTTDNENPHILNLAFYPITPTITKATDFSDLENPVLEYTSPNGELVEKLQACIANDTGGIVYVPYRDISKTGTSYTFELTPDELSILYKNCSGKSTTVRYYIKAETDGEAYRASIAKTFTIKNGKPTIYPIVEDINIETTFYTDNPSMIVRGVSNMSFTLFAEPIRGATITNYSVTCGAQTSNQATGVFNKVESNIFIFSATDSRGFTTTQRVELDMIDYFKPTCHQTVSFIDNDEESGTALVKVVIEGKCFNGDIGNWSNAIEVQIQYIEDNEVENDLHIPIDEVTYTGNSYRVEQILEGFNISTPYSFKSFVSDLFGGASTEHYTIQATPVFDWGKEDFNFNVPVSIQGNALNDFIVETGTETMGSNGTWNWSKWKSGKVECFGCRNYGNMAASTAWGSLYRSAEFNQDFPTGLFIKTPEVIDMRVRNAGYGAWVVNYQSILPTANNTGSFIVVRPEAANLSQTYISFYIVGYWK